MLQLRDEILQVLFWREGEKLGDAATIADLRVLLPAPEGELRSIIERLVVDGLVEPVVADTSYRLTAAGKTEGGRRFVDAFADHGLGGAHGACGPGCEDCLTEGPENCSAHGEGHDHDHGSAR